jgi:hypothetical protein
MSAVWTELGARPMFAVPSRSAEHPPWRPLSRSSVELARCLDARERCFEVPAWKGRKRGTP